MKLEDNVEFASFSKLTKLVKKSFNLIKMEKKKPQWLYSLISYFFPCFVELIERPWFCLTEGLTNDLAISRVKLKGDEVTIGFSKWSLWKIEIIFQKCIIVEKDSQVFFSFR